MIRKRVWEISADDDVFTTTLNLKSLKSFRRLLYASRSLKDYFLTILSRVS